MEILKRANEARRTILKSLTKNVGASNNNLNVGSINKSDIKRVLIIRPNHRLGNQLLITPIVQEVADIFPNCKIDLFVKGNLAPIIFKNYENIDQIIRLPKKHFKQLLQYIFGWLKIRMRHYDIVINAAKGSSSGRLSTKFANATYKFYGDDEDASLLYADDYQHIAKCPVCGLRSCLSKLGVSGFKKEIPVLDLKLSPSELEEGKKIVQNLAANKEAKTICLFTYATGAKCYTETWWSAFHERLKSEYPNFNIIEILPVENVSQIAFKEPSLYSKDIREMAAVMANTDVFIGADSGIMHLASSSKVPVLGLFSVTSVEVYAPYNNNSKGLHTGELTIDQLIEEVNRILLK